METKLKKLIARYATNEAELARVIGVSRMTINNWRDGKNRLPAEAALLIADFFEVDPREVIGLVEETA